MIAAIIPLRLYGLSEPIAACLLPSSCSLAFRTRPVHVRGLTVLDGVDVTVGPRTRLGVVGPNGVGKTTLLRILAGLDRPDRGSVTRTPPNARVGYLPQEPERSERETLLEFLGRRSGVHAADVELERAAAALRRRKRFCRRRRRIRDFSTTTSRPAVVTRLRAATCADLGLPESLLDAPTATLSGGQAARASLAAILVSRFDVFLLDEPTNDLDFAGLARLERFLDELPGGVVVVSHDRTFLERVVTRVLELDEHDRTSTEFGGGWSGYLDARATARRHAEDEYATYRAQRTRLEERARTQRQWAVEGVRKAKTRNTDHRRHRQRGHFRINGQAEAVSSPPGRRSTPSLASIRSRSHGRAGTSASPWPRPSEAVTSSCASRAR